MAVPSFARATAASTLRAAKAKDITTPEQPQGTPKSPGSPRATGKLKRPSTLTIRARESIAYNADLHFIRASNPSKPCPLAALPSEIRSLIYSQVFGDLQRPVLMNYRRVRHSPSVLLQVCRAVRIEAAYMYYTSTAFTWIIKNLNFTTITKWLSNLHPFHRALLSRNRSLTIEIIAGLQNSYTYPPKGFLIDDTMPNHWKACQPFGNLYAVRNDHVRTNFMLFCRLASWLKSCSRPTYVDIEWNYTFDMPQDKYSKKELVKSLQDSESSFHKFLEHQLKYLWIRNRCERRIRQPILDMVEAFIEAYVKMEKSMPVLHVSDSMIERLKATRKLIEDW